MLTQGGESNHSGSFLEDIIEKEFRSRGVAVFDYVEKQENGDLFARSFLLRRVPYQSIYGHHGRSEFVYRHFVGGDIRIECRWQEVPGSVDEKFPYFFLNAKAAPEPEVWLVVDGGGAKATALDWLRRECRREQSKTIRLLTLAEAKVQIKRVLAQNSVELA